MVMQPVYNSTRNMQHHFYTKVTLSHCP